MLEYSKLCDSFLEYLVAQGVIDSAKMAWVREEQRQRTPQIGKIALTHRYLTMNQVNQVLIDQIESGLRFGEQAVVSGYVVEDQVTELLVEQKRARPGVGDLLQELGALDQEEIETYRSEFFQELAALLV